MARIAIYGGTFDPPHIGHLHAAQAAYEALALDHVLFIPANIPPHKMLSPNSATPQQRFEMVSLAVSSYPWAVASDIELRAEGKSYTVDTLRKLRELYPQDELWMIIGTDMLLSLHHWYCPEEIMKIASVAVVGRNFGDMPALSEAKARLEADYGARICIIDCEPLPISSTQVRCMKTNETWADFVVPAVNAYIAANGLYQNDAKEV